LTVNVALQISLVAQALTTVQFTVTLPPAAGGAVGISGDLANTALHPPLIVAVVSQVANLASIVAWVWPGASITSAAQFKTTAGAGAIVNVAEQVEVGSQLLVTFQRTVTLPPQILGTNGRSGIVKTAVLHPPTAVVEVSHAANLTLIAAWVWQAASVTLVAQVTLNCVAADTVKVAVHVFV
jgi:hypothetical protein